MACFLSSETLPTTILCKIYSLPRFRRPLVLIKGLGGDPALDHITKSRYFVNLRPLEGLQQKMDLRNRIEDWLAHLFTDVVLDGFTYDISYKENGQPGKLGMITECLPASIRSILSGPLGKQLR
ncbi:hypothetical protein VNO78_35126 [Psophocarpus tetragonolobus]|uniref:Uncharacterized protein n=1 Tax=Psophocarpus tetragonolobus TaxID=3891 RepID=A0AAN9RGV1_PSOTE